ncbi:MAG: ATP-binding cassette domain-containing protein [Ignavibacteria bacterium]|nr:ATP-binding cassette domain-containing protein [Ignavibacteria bacterium]MBK6771392.1 ATP-binding cassette domain-containing protein [Ignavibacteria bacterium]MBK7159445.1 ATP-binding cassette domain-containing protein [Ignavibacteria bacterium]MBK7254725.1 ATP-binding cassette domain-containing protein [Ignavibacteria bacterium]MBK7446325.1 ATP-binding cassette domain-containing protein [Ignavibacteria bacterium]
MSIKVENLTKYYGQQAAVNDITFEINTGEIVGFLGPNGAGKSTTMKMITTYLTPSAGKIYVNDLSTESESLEVRKKIGYLPEQNPLYLDMNVLDYLEFAAELESVPKSDIAKSIKKMVGVCGLGDVQHKDIGELSKGFKQRVGLAQAMIHEPDVLILDEPTSGLDPNQIIEIRKLIKQLGKEKTLVLSTHILQEVEATCDRVLIINKGQIVADGTPDSLQDKFRGQVQISLVLKKDSVDKDLVLRAISSIRNIEKARISKEDELSYHLLIAGRKGEDVREDIFRKMVSMNQVILGLHQEETSLEDIFRQLTTKSN